MKWYWIFRIFILGTRNTWYLLFIGHNTLTVLWNQDASQLPIFIISSPLYSSCVSQLFRYLESGRLLHGVTFDHDFLSWFRQSKKHQHRWPRQYQPNRSKTNGRSRFIQQEKPYKLICQKWLLSNQMRKAGSLMILLNVWQRNG